MALLPRAPSPAALVSPARVHAGTLDPLHAAADRGPSPAPARDPGGGTFPPHSFTPPTARAPATDPRDRAAEAQGWEETLRGPRDRDQDLGPAGSGRQEYCRLTTAGSGAA